jgi:hypothetical protein
MTVNEFEFVAQSIAYDLFPPGPGREARSVGKGLNSPSAFTLLREEAERIRMKLDGTEADKE